jgi:chromosome segregation ATPase
MNEIEKYHLDMQQQISHIKHTLEKLNQNLKETPKSNYRAIFRLNDQIDNLNSTLIKLQEEYKYKQKLISKLEKSPEFILSSIKKVPHTETINSNTCSDCKQPLMLKSDNATLVCINCSKTKQFIQTTLDHIESSSFAQDTYANHSENMYTKTKNSNFTHQALNTY